MTLILTLGNQEQFIQLSDRRLTSNGRLVDDESNKSGIFLCKDARHVFGFTGLARTGNFETKKWLFDALWDCSPPDYEISKIIQRLKVRATQDFKSIPALKRLKAKDKRLSVMFSGYLYYQKPPLGAWSLITNFQSNKNYADLRI